ncbi:hypothetical protein ACVWZD_002046 [Streptomyces sp. TE3672]
MAATTWSSSGPGEGDVVAGHGAQQRVDRHPAVRVERDADPFRLVAQVFREVLGHLYGAFFIHTVRVPVMVSSAHPGFAHDVLKQFSEVLKKFSSTGLIHSQLELSTSYLAILWTTQREINRFGQFAPF